MDALFPRDSPSISDTWVNEFCFYCFQFGKIKCIIWRYHQRLNYFHEQEHISPAVCQWCLFLAIAVYELVSQCFNHYIMLYGDTFILTPVAAAAADANTAVRLFSGILGTMPSPRETQFLCHWHILLLTQIQIVFMRCKNINNIFGCIQPGYLIDRFHH